MVENNKPQSPPAGGTPDFNKLELEVLKFWDENKIFEKSLEQTKKAIKDPSALPQDESHTPFVFYDGPPFATGLPHHGHIVGSAVKDLVGRYQTMKGLYVRRRWGWDCHGLPIENIVEQNLKISGKKEIEKIGVERFNKVCRDNVLRFVEEWGKMVKRMGRWVDFENSYKTMDTSYMESVWWALKQIWDKGLIYEDRKVLLYCPRCETPISNFEVAMDNSYRDITEESVYAKFKMLPRQRIGNDLTNDKTYALAWTTTPWTLPGNTSLNVGSDIVYVLVQQKDERYILAKERLSILNGEYEIIAEFPGRALEGLSVEPLYPGVIVDLKQKAHKLYSADFVTTTDGTGIVHNAALYGEEDYELAKAKDLPKEEMLDHQGRYLNADNIPENLRGVFFKDADRIILDELKAKGLVYKTENYLHSYPHCYRCGTPLYYCALPAWFINIQKIKPELQKTNEDINWYPGHLKHGRFGKSMEQAPDWNISRNRYWATALPFWKCQNQECKNVVCIGSIQELKDRSVNFDEVYPEFVARPFMGNQGTADESARYTSAELEKLDLHKPYIDQIKLKCEKCGDKMYRVPEVVDCWVESGSMPFAELHYPFENNAESPTTPSRQGGTPLLEKEGRTAGAEDFQNRFPADFVAEYIPQTRAWFYVMHVVSNILFEQAPFKNVVTTGTVLAEDGSKMSKSKGNYPDPWLIIERYGVDALRFYLLSSPVMNAEDLNFSEKGVQEVSRKVSLLLYNMWSFYRLYEPTRNYADLTAAAEPRGNTAASSENVLDRWVVVRLSQVQSEATKQLDSYNTVKACKVLVDFINDLSTWYVRRSRDRMKSSGEDAKAALKTLGFVLAEISKMLAPFMPFLADFIYKDLTGKESVHLELWPAQASSIDEKVISDMEIVREIVSVGLAARKEKTLPVRQPLARVAYVLKDKKAELLPELEKLILEELNIKSIESILIDKSTRPVKVFGFSGVSALEQLYVDFDISPELKQEGLARELERAVQDLRKKSNLKVGELVDVYYNTQDEKLEQTLVELFDRKKTFVSQIQKSFEVEVDFETQSKIDGKSIWIGFIRI